MNSLTAQAILVRDPKTDDFDTDVVHGNNDPVFLNLSGIAIETEFKHLAEVCAENGFNLTIETLSHTFKDTFQEHEVGLQEEPNAIWDALNGRR